MARHGALADHQPVGNLLVRQSLSDQLKHLDFALGQRLLATVRTECVLAPITERRFLYMVQETPQFALQMMRVLAERLRRAHARLPAVL